MDKEFAEIFKEEIVIEGKVEELGKQISGLANKFKEGKDDVMTMADEMIANGKMPDPESIKMLETEESQKIVHLIAKKMGVQWTKDNGYGEMRFKQNYPESHIKKNADRLIEMSKKIKAKEEESEIDEMKSSSGYELYHKDFSSAMQHAYDFAKKKGNTIDTKEIDDKVAVGPKKPSSGKVNRYSLKAGKKIAHIQVANLDNKRYELNMYFDKEYTNKFEEVEVSEGIRDFKMGDKVKFVNDDSRHFAKIGKITDLSGNGISQKATVKLDKGGKSVANVMVKLDLIKEEVEMNEWSISDVEIAMKKKYGKIDDKAISKLKKVLYRGNVDRNDLVKAGHGKLDVGSAYEEVDIDEASKLPPHLAKFFDEKGDLKPEVAARIAKGREKLNIKDVTPKGYGPKEEVEIDEKFAGWIAFYGREKLEIKKSEADGIWPAKQLAFKHFKVPKSKQGLLAIKPAEEQVEGIDIQNASMTDVIKDFKTSDAPQFKGKSDKKRKEMAIAAKLSKEENEDDAPVGKKKSKKDVINLKPTAESSMKKFKDMMTKLKEKRFNNVEEVEMKEAPKYSKAELKMMAKLDSVNKRHAETLLGWIAFHPDDDRRLEITTKEADDILAAQRLAIKKWKVKKSAQHRVAVRPSFKEEVEIREDWLEDEMREVEHRWPKTNIKIKIKWLAKITDRAKKDGMDTSPGSVFDERLNDYGLTKYPKDKVYTAAVKVKPKWKKMSTSARTKWVDGINDMALKAKTSDADIQSILDDLGLKIKEEVEMGEATGDKEAYQKFFKGVLKKFGVKGIFQLKGDKKKEFFDYVDKNWTADHEEETKKEETMTKKSLKDAVSNMQEKKLKVQESITIGGLEVGEQEWDKEFRLDHAAPNLGMTYADYQARFETDGMEGPYQIDGGAYMWDKVATKWFSVETEDYVDKKRNAELNYRYTKQGTAGGGLMHNRRL